MEDLCVKGMVKNKRLSKSISDTSMSKLKQLITYKQKEYDKEVELLGRYEPSTKECHGCGSIQVMSLSDREFGNVKTADELMSETCWQHVISKKFALYKEQSGQELSVEPVEMLTLVESMKQEAHPISSAVGG